MRHSFIRIALVLFSFLLFGGLGLVLYGRITRWKNVLGSTTYVTRLPAETMRESDSPSRFRNFYEPVADSVQVASPPWLGDNVTYVFNHDHLNERYDYDEQKKDGVYRIVTIGDSFTFGQFVDTRDNYSERLEDVLKDWECPGVRDFEVINLGVGGYDVAYTVERFLQRGKKYRPDLVLWLINEHNLLQIVDYLKDEIERLQKIEEKSASSEAQPADTFYGFQRTAEQNLRASYGTAYILDFQMRQIERLLSAYEGRVVMFMFPEVRPWVARAVADAVKGHERVVFSQSLDRLSKKEGNLLPDGHPSKAGHQRIAQNVFRFITEGGVISCNTR